MSQKKLTGGSVDYYSVRVDKPTSIDVKPYTAECNDIIEALNMNFAQGNILKALWRLCAAEHLGKKKDGCSAVYDAEKIIWFGHRLLEQEHEKEARKAICTDGALVG